MSKAGVIVVGSSGRMGKHLTELLKTHPRMSLRESVNSKTKWSSISPKGVDVMIDFSLPQGIKSSLKQAVAMKVPYVCGVTGLGGTERMMLKKAATKIPIFYSANMSYGVAVLKRTLEQLSPLGDFDIVIEEFHHHHKKDKPSGTALSLIESIERSQMRKPAEIHAIRGGGVIGTHRVHFMSEKETLTLEHHAIDRSVFADGALRAAEWILKKGPGMYSMRDLLGNVET